MNPRNRINQSFFTQDVLTIAPLLLGMKLACRDKNGIPAYYNITETEAYKGEEDLACHASKGRTARTEIMYRRGGFLYIYLIYGIHWMLNIVSGKEEDPQAILIRGLDGISGPGRVTKALGIDRSYNAEDLVSSSRIWLEPGVSSPGYTTSPRVGIDYAGPIWKLKPWRFILNESPTKQYKQKSNE
ncbi:MAG: DNA-3-methyladenine glycosylase [Bacteroidales bacterium]